MEKTRFYNREDLKAKDVARLISIWEGEAGESFTDYCNFSREADKNFLLFLAEKYPILYDYHCKVAGNDWLDHCIQYVVDHCGEYLTQWVPAQAAMVVEECSQLTNAICKFRRGRVGEDDIITEIADVMIMCEQLSNYFGKEKVALERERKLTRLEERLSKYEQV